MTAQGVTGPVIPSPTEINYRWWQLGSHPRLWGWVKALHDGGGWRWRLFCICAAPLFVIESLAAPVVSRIWPNRRTL